VIKLNINVHSLVTTKVKKFTGMVYIIKSRAFCTQDVREELSSLDKNDVNIIF
jgi:hypothetical protein